MAQSMTTRRDLAHYAAVTRQHLAATTAAREAIAALLTATTTAAEHGTHPEIARALEQLQRNLAQIVRAIAVAHDVASNATKH